MANFNLGAQINFTQEKREGRMGFTLDCGSKEEQLDKWKETDGDCVEANFKKYWELGTKFGFENFAMVEQQTYPLSEEGFVEDAKLMKENFVIHHLVLNKKLNVVMDFSNNRTVIVDYETYKKEFNCPAYYVERDGRILYNLTGFWIYTVEGSDDLVSKFEEFMKDGTSAGSLIYLGLSCHHHFQSWWRRRHDKPYSYGNLRAFALSKSMIPEEYLTDTDNPYCSSDEFKYHFNQVLNKDQIITGLD